MSKGDTVSDTLEAVARAWWDSEVGEVGDWDRFRRVAGDDHVEVRETLNAARAALTAVLADMAKVKQSGEVTDWLAQYRKENLP